MDIAYLELSSMKEVKTPPLVYFFRWLKQNKQKLSIKMKNENLLQFSVLKMVIFPLLVAMTTSCPDDDTSRKSVRSPSILWL